MDRDENAAVNILDRALNEVGLISSARGGFGNTQPLKREYLLQEATIIRSSVDGG